jgi:hypothetical protein
MHILTLAEYLAAIDRDEPFMCHQKEDICRRSSARQAEEDIERTAGDENIKEVMEPISQATKQTTSHDNFEEPADPTNEAATEPTSKAASHDDFKNAVDPTSKATE